MGTRSHIGLMFDDGSIGWVYCHHDSDRNGKILREHYDTPVKIMSIMRQGDMSSLGETIEDCVFYTRDRHEPLENNEMHTQTNEEEFLYVSEEDYTYLFKEGKWWSRKWKQPLVED